jgi:translation initiation factor 2 subunit 1
MKEFPERGEIVICKVKRILDYGVFVDLLEFKDIPGFIHISNVATSWVKNIRNVVKENQVKAGKVIFVDLEKKQVDIAFNKISESQGKAAINAFKSAKRSQKLVEVLAREQKKPFEQAWKEVAEPLIQEHESLFNAFNEIKSKGEKALEKIPVAWHKPLLELIEKNIQLPVRLLKGSFSVQCTLPDGVEIIKHALSSASSKKGVELAYGGAGTYFLRVSSTSFKSAEKMLEQISNGVLQELKEKGCKAEFKRTGE